MQDSQLQENAVFDIDHHYINLDKPRDGRSIMAQIGFDGPCQSREKPGQIATGLPCLSGLDQQELWLTSRALSAGKEGLCEWVSAGDYALIAVWHNCLPPRVKPVTEQVYASLFACMKKLNFNYPLRIWNYLPQINKGEGDLENYKQFCLGRKGAFDAAHIDSKQYPAASALGHRQEQLVVYALVGGQSGRHFENPEQISAYQYPKIYGPESPSFARATLVGDQRLYFSGTASVVGHQSVYAGDVQAQTKVTIGNLQALFKHVGQSLSSEVTITIEALKIYLRHAADQKAIAAIIEEEFPRVPAIYLQADICRSELLVEIDGHCGIAYPGSM